MGLNLSRSTLNQIHAEMVRTIRYLADMRNGLTVRQPHADGYWEMSLSQDSQTLTLGGYASESYPNGADLDDLSFTQLGMLLDEADRK